MDFESSPEERRFLRELDRKLSSVGTRQIRVDQQSPEGRGAIEWLVERVDVVIESGRPASRAGTSRLVRSSRQ